MALQPTRKELLVFGWVRENKHTNIPEDLVKIMELLSYDVVQWLVEGEKFKQLFARTYSTNGGWCYSNPEAEFGELKMKAEGFKFKLSSTRTSWRFRSTKYYIQLTLIEDQPVKDSLALKVLLKFKGNICETPTRLELTYNISPSKFGWSYLNNNNHKIFTIEASEPMIDLYDKFDMLFQI